MSDRKTSAEDLADRIDALEARMMYQDDTIETLNLTITAQWSEIDALRRQISRLNERIAVAETNTGGPSNERPPHY